MGTSITFAGFNVWRTSPWHDTLLFTTKGSGEVWTGGRWRVCTPGTAYWSPSGGRHGYRCAGGEWTLAWLTARPQESLLRRARLGTVPSLLGADEQDGPAFILQYCREASGKSDGVMLELIASLLVLAIGRLGTEPSMQRLGPLWQEVDGRLGHDWSLTELAARANLGTEQLRAVCIQECGEPPMRYLRKLRMVHAATLLSSASDTIERVARQVGYEDPFAFSTAFKRHFLSSPRDYRRRAGP